MKKERQQEKGGTPGAPDPKPKVPASTGKTGGTNSPPKGEKKTPVRRSVRFQNLKEKERHRPATPPTTKKDTVQEAVEEESLSDPDEDTGELADLPTDSEPEGSTGEAVGEDQTLEEGPQ